MPPKPSRHDPAPANPALAEGLRWGLAAVLVLQVFVAGLAPSLLVTVLRLARWYVARGIVLDLTPLVSSAIPWLVFLGAQLAHIGFLRRLGSYPYTNGQVALMALLPGYNLFGSVELFASQGATMERLGAARGLALELRALAAMASGLAVAVAVLVARALGSVLDASVVPAPVQPGLLRSIIVLSLALLLVRLAVLARVQIATRSLLVAQRAGALPDLEPQPALPGLPGPRRSVAVTALALAAGWNALTLPPPPLRGRPLELEIFTTAPFARAPAPEPARAPEAAAPSAPPPTPSHVAGGRTVEWWRDRLRALAVRGDADGQQLFEATRARAVANGLEIAGAGAELRVEPGAERIAGPAAEGTRSSP